MSTPEALLTAFEQLAASMLDSSATALAGHAANRLLEEHPETSRRFAPDAFSSWRAHLSVRARELAVAVELASPELFASAVDWARASFTAREVPEEDLRASLLCLQAVLSEELPDPARNAVRPCFELAFDSFKRPVKADEALAADAPNQRLALAYIETCLSGDPRRAIQDVLAAVDSGLDVQTAYLDVVRHAQREVGRLWHEAKLGVHEEHLITSTTFNLMTLLANRAQPAREVDKTAVGAALGDDAHDVGVRMIMDLFTIVGWRSICLGSHLPGSDVKVLVGGLALQAAPEVWRRLEADGYGSSADVAVAEGEKLLGIS
jgi:methanogenic corrinoid protein MtbC1